MGHLLSRVRKKTSVTDVLEQVEKEIKVLENFQRSTEQKQKRLIGSLILYSVIIYIGLGTFLYFYWFPSSLRDQCLYAIPLLLFPILVWFLKRVLQKYFKWKIETNADQLTELLQKRRSILNDVKEQETYKKAKEILEKFDPEYKLQEQQKKDAEALLAKRKEIAASGMEMRRRSFPNRGNTPPVRPAVPTTNLRSLGMMQGAQRFPQNGRQFLRPPGPPLARPILPRERGLSDRLVDYLVGDGPSNRYALICKQCFSHNGMALKEEFEYITFRCCYCYVLNPARKERPQAPSLPVTLPLTAPAPSQTSESEDEQQKEEADSETSKVESEVFDEEPTKEKDDDEDVVQTEHFEKLEEENEAKEDGEKDNT